jgi:tetratricopeptide (TPR) repeat protein
MVKQIILLFSIALASHQCLNAQTDKHREAAMKFIDQGEVAKAKDKMDEALRISPEIGENHYVMGRVLMGLRDASGALVEFAKADSLKFSSSDLFLYQGIANFIVGNNDKALAAFDKAEKINPKDYKITYNRALLFLELQRLDDAMVNLNKSIDLKSDFGEAYLSRAMVSYEDEKFKNCIIDCNKAIELKPSLADAYYYRAMSNGGIGKDKEAIVDFDKAVEINPNHDNALNHRASAKYLSGNKKGACRDWEKAKDLGNDEADTNYATYCE